MVKPIPHNTIGPTAFLNDVKNVVIKESIVEGSPISIVEVPNIKITLRIITIIPQKNPRQGIFTIELHAYPYGQTHTRYQQEREEWLDQFPTIQ